MQSVATRYFLPMAEQTVRGRKGPQATLALSSFVPNGCKSESPEHSKLHHIEVNVSQREWNDRTQAEIHTPKKLLLFYILELLAEALIAVGIGCRGTLEPFISQLLV